MNASETQTYAKAVRDLAEAAQMTRLTTPESKEARRAAEKAMKEVANLISASHSEASE